VSGGEPVDPPIPGANLPHVVQAWDVLATKTAGRRVVVVVGCAVGVETTMMLVEEGALSGEEIKFLLVNAEDLYDPAVKGSKQLNLV